MADEIVQIVRIMDGLNRVRFTDDDELLPAWEYASTVGATPIRAPGEPAFCHPEPKARDQLNRYRTPFG